jgi:hypothetical protein
MPRLTELPAASILADNDELYAVVGGNSRRIAAAGFRGQVFLTPQSTASGTLFDFTGIPAWASEISVLFNQVSLSGTDNIRIQIGTASAFETTGYASSGFNTSGAVLASSGLATDGFSVRVALSTRVISGFAFIKRYDPSENQWHYSASLAAGGDNMSVNGGVKTLAGTLTRVRITRTGSNTFAGGAINVSYR